MLLIAHCDVILHGYSYKVFMAQNKSKNYDTQTQNSKIKTLFILSKIAENPIKFVIEKLMRSQDDK